MAEVGVHAAVPLLKARDETKFAQWWQRCGRAPHVAAMLLPLALRERAGAAAGLLAREVHVDSPLQADDERGWYALHYAAYYNSPEVTKAGK